MRLADFDRLLRPLRNRVANMLARAVVDLVDDAKDLQIVQLTLLDGETREGVERLQNYGFTSWPVKGAEAVVAFVGGRRDHGYAAAVDDRRYRLKLSAEGEVAMYDQTGSSIVMKANGDIEVTPSSGVVTMTGDLNVSGTVTGTTDVVGGGKSLKTHAHSATGSVAAAPGPVTFVPPGRTGAPV